jgi:ligand-binding SRPBCC domain-containing protein
VANHVFERHQVLDRPAVEVFEFFADPNNLGRVTPAGLRFRFLEPPPDRIHAGVVVRHQVRLNGIPVNWVTRITEWDPPNRFVDDQLSGPYRAWRHTHMFREVDRGRTLMTDLVEYDVGLGPLGEVARRIYVEAQLGRIFEYRARALNRTLGEPR